MNTLADVARIAAAVSLVGACFLFAWLSFTIAIHFEPMPSIDIRLDGDKAFADVPADKVVDASQRPIRIAALVGGMVSGKPSVAIGIFLDDGGVVLGQTSLALFLSAADALKARFGDPRS